VTRNERRELVRVRLHNRIAHRCVVSEGIGLPFRVTREGRVARVRRAQLAVDSGQRRFKADEVDRQALGGVLVDVEEKRDSFAVRVRELHRFATGAAPEAWARAEVRLVRGIVKDVRGSESNCEHDSRKCNGK